MIFTDEIKDWLPWVIKIRFVIIIFVFAIDYAIHSLAPNPANAASIRYLGVAVILWFILSLFFLIYNQISQRLSAASVSPDLIATSSSSPPSCTSRATWRATTFRSTW